MNAFRRFLISCLVSLISISNYAQVIQKTGYIYSEVSSIIANMPGSNGNDYREPNSSELNTWANTLQELFSGNYTKASDSANKIGYNLIHLTDTFVSPFVNYYILQTADTNFWGTYVYNPNYCRPLVIQSPHAKKDANTGHQGIHIFRKTEALFYQVNGTHRCNSSIHSSCTGTTSTCSSTAEPYRNSDLAHNTQSLFQKTTETLFNRFNNTYFIQLHGFTKQSTDPYVILSNGTQQTPFPDYMSSFKNHLFNEDSVLTFKIAHIDLNWTRLRGFWNTQSRLINGSSNPCNSSTTTSNGRFFHLEQERVRLRSNVSAWNKVANALNNTFLCNAVSISNKKQEEIKVYPNPSQHSINVTLKKKLELNKEKLVYNLMGQNKSSSVRILQNSDRFIKLDISNLATGVYLLKLENSFIKIYKN